MLWRRLIHIIKADLHGAIDQLEDKPALLRHYLREMTTATAKVRLRLKTMQREYDDLSAKMWSRQATINALDGDIDRAIGAQKVTVARMLIRKKKILARGRALLEERIGVMRNTMDTLETRIDEQTLAYESLLLEAQSRFGEGAFANVQNDDPCEAVQSTLLDSAAFREEEIEQELASRMQAQTTSKEKRA